MRIVERTGSWLILSETHAKPRKVLNRNPSVIKERNCPLCDNLMPMLRGHTNSRKKGSKVDQILIKITKLVHQVK